MTTRGTAMTGHEITCPHSDCDDVLILQWHAAYTLSPPDLAVDGDSITVDMAHIETWSVECVAGHVLLLPGPLGCPCDDPEGPGCPHNLDVFDWSDDYRIFRTHDYQRLRQVLAVLGTGLETPR